MNSLFSVYGETFLSYVSFLLSDQSTQQSNYLITFFILLDIYDDLISRRVNSSDAEKFAEICPCPCTGVGWGMIWLVPRYIL